MTGGVATGHQVTHVQEGDLRGRGALGLIQDAQIMPILSHLHRRCNADPGPSLARRHAHTVARCHHTPDILDTCTSVQIYYPL